MNDVFDNRPRRAYGIWIGKNLLAVTYGQDDDAERESALRAWPRLAHLITKVAPISIRQLRRAKYHTAAELKSMIANSKPAIGDAAAADSPHNEAPPHRDDSAVAGPGRGPIIQDECPSWPHESGGPWARGLTADGRCCWV